MTTLDRRRFLQLSGGSALATLFASSIERALAIPAASSTGTLQDVEHIVVLMQENRSFDHYFGSLRGVRGFGDPRPLTLPGGKPVFYQPQGQDGAPVLPFHPNAPDLGLVFLEDLNHDWNGGHKAWHDGQYDRWVPVKTATTMAFLDRQDIPFHYALADAFTICDAYHCSLVGPTDPNRYYMWTGYVGNDGTGGGPVISNAEAGYSWTTYPERLEQAGISWKVYQDIGDGLDAAGSWGYTSDAYIGNYGDNSLLYFDAYRNAQPGSALYDKARTGTNANAGDGYFDLLKADVLANQLPQVSWIVAPEAYTEHPNWPANYGAWYVSQVLDALTANPDVWSRTVLLITYDENDGFFDHMIPPSAPASRAQGLSTASTGGEFFPGGDGNLPGPYGLGQRVPMLVVSPWSKGGSVCSQTFDHTSIIRFIERRFGVQEPNISPWRRAVCGDLTSAFDFANPDATPATLPDTAAYVPPDQDRHDSYEPKPPVVPQMPVQEAGQRPARALPYTLQVDVRADPDKSRVWLDFLNAGSAGAAFHVTSTKRSDGPWHYTVEAGKGLTDAWNVPPAATGEYQFTVLGPNGFYREFSGQLPKSTSAARPEVSVGNDPASGGLKLLLTNRGGKPCELLLSEAYGNPVQASVKLRPGASVSLGLSLAASQSWYDLSVTEPGGGFLRRYAGHVETGLPSLSDPKLSPD